MSVILREPTPAQLAANRANSLLSTGPRTPWGKAHSTRNLPKLRLFSEVVERSMEVLGERPQEFEQMHTALAEAMEPRDAWEAAWVEDIAILRSRLQRLRRAELAAAALRRRRSQYQRQRAAFPPTGADALKLNHLIGAFGFTGIPDCALKFQQVIDLLEGLRTILLVEQFDPDDALYFSLLYGKAMGPCDAALKTRFDAIAKKYEGGNPSDTPEARKSLSAELDKEIARYKKLQALYAAEHLEAGPLQDDADLLPPAHELDAIIRYETHLEAQIEGKLRQFYARRRESALTDAEPLPDGDGTRLGRLGA